MVRNRSRFLVGRFFALDKMRFTLWTRLLLRSSAFCAASFVLWKWQAPPPSGWKLVAETAAAILCGELLLRWLLSRLEGWLARATMKVQDEDLRGAFWRIFERTQLDMDSLQIFREVYSFGDHAGLLDEESLETRLKKLESRSIRAICWPQLEEESVWHLRYAKLPGSPSKRPLYNPMRLVALFLGDTQVVIGDVQIDAINPGGKENIDHIELSKLVNVSSSATTGHNRPALLRHGRKRVLRLAHNAGMGFWDRLLLGYEYWICARGKNLEYRYKYLPELVEADIVLSGVDGSKHHMPVWRRWYFGRSAGTREGGFAVTPDEALVDRMVNELNRRITATKTAPPEPD